MPHSSVHEALFFLAEQLERRCHGAIGGIYVPQLHVQGSDREWTAKGTDDITGFDSNLNSDTKCPLTMFPCKQNSSSVQVSG